MKNNIKLLHVRVNTGTCYDFCVMQNENHINAKYFRLQSVQIIALYSKGWLLQTVAVCNKQKGVGRSAMGDMQKANCAKYVLTVDLISKAMAEKQSFV